MLVSNIYIVFKAMLNLGIMILHGRGVVQSDIEAFKWFLEAANQGFDKAQYTGISFIIMAS